MKYIKMLGLLAVSAATLMAFAGTASATSITSNDPKDPATPTITAINEGHVTLHGAFTSVTCAESHVAGKVEKHGVNVTASGKIATLSFGSCTGGTPTVKNAGELEVHAISPTGNGTLTSTGAVIEIHTSVGLCTFTTNATHIGTLTGSNNVSPVGNATLDINSANIPRTGGSFLCGSNGVWTGFYRVTNPSILEVHAS
jgi:hypothetical protein